MFRGTPCTKRGGGLYFELVGKGFGKERLFLKVRYYSLQCATNVVFISMNNEPLFFNKLMPGNYIFQLKVNPLNLEF